MNETETKNKKSKQSERSELTEQLLLTSINFCIFFPPLLLSYSFFTLVWRFFSSGFFAVSEKAVLMLVFVVSMEHADLLHFVYIIFFVVFVTSTDLAKNVKSDYAGIYYPSLLMIFLLIQYNFFQTQLEAMNMSQFNFEDYVLKNTSIRRNSLGFALLYFAYFIPLDGWILITYVVFLLIGLSELHLINLGYVLIALLIHSIFEQRLVQSPNIFGYLS
ncbi:hypothetical protein RFI_22626 [Reticulomyxa filosa]|uniref:Uncharacterized protein n=1 Tax=Reticulomyxa filosa TaxID=46433 RepID=X6MMS4_RETFI|nr:hypothetical protein RFI_22626 [Reticulomyxa filosa]|eukprot:ETO14742.1 hypothetical protein RFI_22626 [Reticulomyxa filosa]